MKTLIASFLVKSVLLAGLFGSAALIPDSAHAASSSAKASSLASSMGGSVLSVSARGNKCVVVLLVRSKKGPPKRKTVVVSK